MVWRESRREGMKGAAREREEAERRMKLLNKRKIPSGRNNKVVND